jgi:hypothetical protein
MPTATKPCIKPCITTHTSYMYSVVQPKVNMLARSRDEQLQPAALWALCLIRCVL